MTSIQRSIDVYVWRNLIPAMNTGFFNHRITALGSLVYVSLFPLARKFLYHYLSGNGRSCIVDTEKVIRANPEIYFMVQKAVSDALADLNNSGELQVSQLHVTHPNYKYAIGSFELRYRLEENILTISLHSNYHYTEDVDRLTRCLHNRMVALKTSHRARDFDIEGAEWRLPVKEFSSVPVERRIRPRIDFNRLYL